MATTPAITTNAAAAAERLRAAQVAVRGELRAERQLLAQSIAAEMKRRAPKGVRTTLANSITVQDAGEDETIIRPTVAYAQWVEQGRRPGKGLPWWDTPAAQGAMAWVRGMLDKAAREANPRYRRGAAGSDRRSIEDLQDRVSYFLISQAIKRRGIKATHFIRDTAAAVRPQASARLLEAVRRGTAQMKLDGIGGSGGRGGAA